MYIINIDTGGISSSGLEFVAHGVDEAEAEQAIVEYLSSQGLWPYEDRWSSVYDNVTELREQFGVGFHGCITGRGVFER